MLSQGVRKGYDRLPPLVTVVTNGLRTGRLGWRWKDTRGVGGVCVLGGVVGGGCRGECCMGGVLDVICSSGTCKGTVIGIDGWLSAARCSVAVGWPVAVLFNYSKPGQS